MAAVQRLFASRLAPPVGFLLQLVVDLSRGTPRLEFLSDPPVYAPNGGTFAGGLVYWGRYFRVSGNAGVFVVLEGFVDGCCRCVRREYVDWKDGAEAWNQDAGSDDE
jgi:hypothetical protein